MARLRSSIQEVPSWIDEGAKESHSAGGPTTQVRSEDINTFTVIDAPSVAMVWPWPSSVGMPAGGPEER